MKAFSLEKALCMVLAGLLYLFTKKYMYYVLMIFGKKGYFFCQTIERIENEKVNKASSDSAQ